MLPLPGGLIPGLQPGRSGDFVDQRGRNRKALARGILDHDAARHRGVVRHDPEDGEGGIVGHEGAVSRPLRIPISDPRCRRPAILDAGVACALARAHGLRLLLGNGHVLAVTVVVDPVHAAADVMRNSGVCHEDRLATLAAEHSVRLG